MSSPPGPFWNYPVETVKDCITVRTVPDPAPATSTPAAALPSSDPAAALPSSTQAAALPSSTPAAALSSSPPVVSETVAPEEAPRRRRRPRATSAELRWMFRNRNRDLAPEDDWTQMTNRVDIRRVQNRVSQRSYPTGMRRRIQDVEAQEEAERMRINDAIPNPNGVPNTGMIDMSSLPLTYRQLGGEWSEPPPDWNSVPSESLESPQPSSTVWTPPTQATVRRRPRRVRPALTQSSFRPVWDDFYQSQEAGMFDSYPDNQQGNSGSQSSPTSQVTSSMSQTDAEHLRSLPSPSSTTWRSPASLFQTNRRAANLGTPSRAVNLGAAANRPNPFGFRSPQPSPSVMGQMSLPQAPHRPVARNSFGFSTPQPSPSVIGQMSLPPVPHRPDARNSFGFSSLQPSPSVMGQMSLPQVPNRPVFPWEQVLEPRIQSQVLNDTSLTAPWTGAGPSRADEENIESATRPMPSTEYGAFEDIATAYYAIQPSSSSSTSLSTEDHVTRSKRLLEAIANAYYGTDTVPDMDRRVFLQHVLQTVMAMLKSHTTGSSSQLAFLWENQGDASAHETLKVLKRMVETEFPRSWALNMALVEDVSGSRGRSDASNLALIIICLQRCSGPVERAELLAILRACL
ncbi:hypothetical protein E4U39_006282 [Claviceps sp. Clav50 group G5]|nr:hypothetical protein E4U39_006282 [Claviceps sp. Clav50 group G5]